MTVMKIFLECSFGYTIWSLKIRCGELFQVENWRSNFLLWQFACAAVRAASVTKLNLLKERGNSSPYFKSPKPSKESLHFHFPFFLFTMTIQTTSFFNEFHLVSKQPKNNNVKMYFCPMCNLKCILNLIFSPLFE